MCDSFVADFTVSYFLALRRGDGAGGDGDKGVDTRTLVTRPVFDEKEISTKLASILAHNIVQKKIYTHDLYFTGNSVKQEAEGK